MRAQYILTIVLLVFYALLTGGQPSVVRATIMATIFLSSFLVERELDVLNSLAGAALIILLCNPLNLFDVGFQLSFVSVWAIILFYGLFLNLLFKRIPILQRKPWRYFAQSLAVSLSAWLGVAGLIAYYFNIITPITILANLFIIPISSLLIALGLGLLWMGFFLPSWGFVFALCIKVLINLMIACVFVFSQIPFAYFCLESVSLTQVIIYYMSISILGFLLRLKRFWKTNGALTSNGMDRFHVFKINDIASSGSCVIM